MEKVDSRLNRRQIELMKKRFDVDEENKIVKLDLYYDRADDILQSNLDTKVPNFDREKFGRIKEVISDFPNDYKADLNIKIDDYEGYKPEELLDGFNDAVELTHYSGNRAHKKKWVQIVFLLLAGILLLNLMARGIVENWLDLNETSTGVLKEVFDITSWVFIWQAVSLWFLSPTEDRVTSLTLSYRIRYVAFLDKEDKVLVKEDYHKCYDRTNHEKKLRTIGKYLLLLSGAAFFGLGISNLITAIIDIPNYPAMFTGEGEYLAASIILGVLVIVVQFSLVAFEILGGFAAISAFTGKVGKLYKLVLPFGIIVFVIELASFILRLVQGQFSVSSLIGFIIALAYLLGVIFLMATKEKPMKDEK